MFTRASGVRSLVPQHFYFDKLPKDGGVFGIRLISDLHVGSANFDEELALRDLEEAKKEGDRILINGDVMDLILPGDYKRYTPGVLAKRLQGREDVINETVQMAYELLAPYAGLIDMIGVGNHEAAVIRRHSMDVTRLLVERLNTRKHSISYGGYTGLVVYNLYDGPYSIFYHHGAGKGSDVGSIMTSLRSKSWARADLFWEGHRHGKLNFEELALEPFGFKPVRYVATSSYVPIYAGHSQTEIKEMGHKSEFAAEVALTPHGLGGARLLLDWPNGFRRARVLQ